jgi:exodeoxyribonuclease V alpha subunit
VSTPSPPSEANRLTGVLERIIFLNEENAYTIAELRPEAPPGAGKPPTVTVVGPLPGVECGETLHLTGEWTRHAQHGAQFKVAAFRTELPASVYGIRKYLGSGLVSGIGPAYAHQIVDVFGADTFRILSEESGRLRDVPGIGRKRAAAIKRAWDEKRAERELYIFLQTYGVTPGQCLKLVARYGAQAKAVLTGEPYRVAREIDGIGFKTADRIAINLGFANDAPPRLDAGLLYALATLQEDGHTAYGEDELGALATELLATQSDRVRARIAALVEARDLVRQAGAAPGDGMVGAPLLQLPVHDRAEARIAAAVHRLSVVASGLPPIKVEAALDWAEARFNAPGAPAARSRGGGRPAFEFHALQRAAIGQALRSKVSILTGGPGTGKTSCLRALVDILKAKRVRVHLAAPTGRAAQRLAEATGGFASTIHRLLRYDAAAGGFTANEDHPLATEFLIVDEASMLDTRLAAALLSAVPARAHVLLVGDVDQLPSVGPGNILKDLIATGRIPVMRLDAVFRQHGTSGIVATAHAINHGDAGAPPVSAAWNPADGADLVFLSAASQEACVETVLRLCAEDIPRHCPGVDPVNDVQVLAPLYKGAAGVANLNLQLQAALNGRARGVRTPAGELRPGDKIIQLRNNYDKNLFNGDIGVVTAAAPEAGTLEARFDGAKQTFERGELGDLALAWAISIHKSQGSEYPIVVIPLLKAHFMMLQRNLLYTAITRGKRKVFLVGEPAAYAMAVRNSEARRRVTHLREKVLAAFAG